MSTRQPHLHIEMAQFHLPPKLDVTDMVIWQMLLGNGNVSWKSTWKLVELPTSPNSDKQRQTAIILHSAGPQVLEVYDHFQFDEEDDKHDPAKVLEKLEEYCNPRINIAVQSFRFWNIPFHEPFNVFLTELHSRAASCNFKKRIE